MVRPDIFSAAAGAFSKKNFAVGLARCFAENLVTTHADLAAVPTITTATLPDPFSKAPAAEFSVFEPDCANAANPKNNVSAQMAVVCRKKVFI